MGRRDLDAILVFGRQALDIELYDQIASVLLSDVVAAADSRPLMKFGEMLEQIPDKQRRAVLAISIDSPNFVKLSHLLMAGFVIGYMLFKEKGDFLKTGEEASGEADLQG